MKRIAFLSCATVSALGLAGCATIDDSATKAGLVTVVDLEKIQQVESAARHVNLKVIWINEPTKQVAAATVR